MCNRKNVGNFNIDSPNRGEHSIRESQPNSEIDFQVSIALCHFSSVRIPSDPRAKLKILVPGRDKDTINYTINLSRAINQLSN